MQTSIGIDLGGTWMRAALVAADGTLLHVLRERTQPAGNAPSAPAQAAQALLVRMAALCRRLPGFENACGVGIGVPAAVDPRSGVLRLASNLPGFESLAPAAALQALLRLPVSVENDANVACLAEALTGAGKGIDTVVYVTVSTGIGGGIYDRGRLLSGMRGCAGEFGSLCIDPHRAARLDLGPGAVESEASGEAIVRRAQERLGRPFAHAGEVCALAASGDRQAAALLDDVALDIAQLLAAVACVLDPGVFVLGGGVMQSAEVLIPRVKAAYTRLVPAAFAEIPLRRAALAEPGLTGAGLLAFEHKPPCRA
jgi:glucokinase